LGGTSHDATISVTRFTPNDDPEAQSYVACLPGGFQLTLHSPNGNEAFRLLDVPHHAFLGSARQSSAPSASLCFETRHAG
jgi:hypothetical protein